MTKTGDNLQPSYPINSFRQDWAFYGFVAGRGSSSTLYAAPSSRYTFWLDYDPFDIRNTKLLSKNVNMEIWQTSSTTTPLVPYIILSQFNDMTDDLVNANLPSSYGQTTSIPAATIYYPLSEYVDEGSYFQAQTPPTSSSNSNIPTGLVATVTNSGGNIPGAASPNGTLLSGQTYYYCMTSVNGSNVESTASSVVSATPYADLDGIAVQVNITSGYTYNLYRNTVNDFTPTGGAVVVNVAGITLGMPGYYLNTVFTSQPTNTTFKTDQGWYGYTYGYQGYSYAFGNGTMLAQGFVPTQSHLTSISIGHLQHINNTNPTTYYTLNFELWNSSNQFIQHLGSVAPQVNIRASNVVTGDSSATLSYTAYSSNLCTDGNNYWTSLDGLTLNLTSPANVSPKQTYYIVVRQSPTSASAYYSLGMNTDSTNTRSQYYYYPFANAYSATDGATSGWSQINDTNGKPITFPFITQGMIGRFATTFWWNKYGTVYWAWNAPDPAGGTFQYLHLDYNQRI